MTILAKVVTLTAKDVKDAELSAYQITDLAAALEEAGYKLCVEK